MRVTVCRFHSPHLKGHFIKAWFKCALCFESSFRFGEVLIWSFY